MTGKYNYQLGQRRPDGFSIICDAREGDDLGIRTLGLVDRAKTKRLWWTSDEPNLLLRYESQSAAEYACKRLKLNSPRVVSYARAAETLAIQANTIADVKRQREEMAMHEEAMDCVESGWQGHKVFSGSSTNDPF